MARRLADIVGIDYYPRHALLGAGPRTVYLDGGLGARSSAGIAPWARRWARVMIAEGQAEPWETATTPPSPAAEGDV